MSVYDNLASILRKAQGSITEDGGEIDVGREVVRVRSAYEAQVARITQLESDNAALAEDSNLVADENQRLKRIAESAVRYLTHQDYDGLLNALRAEGYLGGGE